LRPEIFIPAEAWVQDGATVPSLSTKMAAFAEALQAARKFTRVRRCDTL
jgi:hypothetical protein